MWGRTMTKKLVNNNNVYFFNKRGWCNPHIGWIDKLIAKHKGEIPEGQTYSCKQFPIDGELLFMGGRIYNEGQLKAFAQEFIAAWPACQDAVDALEGFPACGFDGDEEFVDVAMAALGDEEHRRWEILGKIVEKHFKETK